MSTTQAGRADTCRLVNNLSHYNLTVFIAEKLETLLIVVINVKVTDRSTKGLLTGVFDVEEPVLVQALPVELGHGSGHGDHGTPGGEQEQGGGGGERESVPDDGGQLAHGELLRHKVLHLVNTWQRLLLKYSTISILASDIILCRKPF